MRLESKKSIQVVLEVVDMNAYRKAVEYITIIAKASKHPMQGMVSSLSR